jgi:hypothetical protein
MGLTAFVSNGYLCDSDFVLVFFVVELLRSVRVAVFLTHGEDCLRLAVLVFESFAPECGHLLDSIWVFVCQVICLCAVLGKVVK